MSRHPGPPATPLTNFSLLYAPSVLLAAIVISAAFSRVVSDYRRTMKALRQLIPAGQSPVFQHLNSITTGLVTIRAYGRASHYEEKVYPLIDQRTKVGWHLSLGIKWMNFRVGTLGVAFVIIVAAAVVPKRDAALAGLAVSMAMQLSKSLTQMVRRYGKVKSAFVAVERIMVDIDRPTETEAGNETPTNWPSCGEMAVHNLTVSYEPNGRLALDNINFHVKPGQRIGIVGRTGAGKTTLAHSFLRFMESESGKIVIDDVDIASLKLVDLRRAISIIPQEPFLFTGTLRANLDLQGLCSDKEIYRSLSRVGLNGTEKSDGSNHTTQSSLFDLNSPINDGGSNLSHGQRQLICLARALLSKSRILIIDEATSSIDQETDTMIQDVIRTEFAGCTILAIAHRLSTVDNFDKILVLDGGKLVEDGSPGELMAKKGLYWRMKQKS